MDVMRRPPSMTATMSAFKHPLNNLKLVLKRILLGVP
jgi:hypothetical protein